MTKLEFLKIIANLADEDEIIILKDGGEYWGDYYDELKIDIKYVDELIGHPGGNGPDRRVIKCDVTMIIS